MTILANKRLEAHYMVSDFIGSHAYLWSASVCKHGYNKHTFRFTLGRSYIWSLIPI